MPRTGVAVHTLRSIFEAVVLNVKTIGNNNKISRILPIYKMSNSAKEIFEKYSGSKFQMMRDGVLSEYKTFKISKKVEDIWLKKIISSQFNQLDITSIDTFFPLWYIIQHHGITEYFDNLEEFIMSNSIDQQSRNGAQLFIDKIISVLKIMSENKNGQLIKEFDRFEQLRAEIRLKNNRLAIDDKNISKTPYKISWYEFLILGAISLLLSLAVLFKWFSTIIGDRIYSEIGSSSTSGLAYSIAKLENTNWRLILVIIFVLISCLFLVEGYKSYNKRN